MFSEARFSAAASRIGARYETIMSSAQWERLFAAPNAAEAIRIFREFPFYTGTVEIERPEDFERLLSAALHETRDFLTQFVSDENFLKVLMLPFDLQNAKISFRTFFLGRSYETIHESLSPLAFFPSHSAFSLLEGKEEVPDRSRIFFAEALSGATKIAEEFPEEPMRAEDFLNAAFFAEMKKCVRKAKIPALSEYFSELIRVENIRRLVRRFPERSEGEMDFFAPEQKKSPFLSLSRKKAIEIFSATPLADFLREGLMLSDPEETFCWERRLLLAPLLPIKKEAFVSPLSAEKVARYFFERVIDAELLRAVFVGKLNHESSEKIRKTIIPLFHFLKK